MTITTTADALDRRFQALSDPKRRRILALLGDEERCVCELVDKMEVSQSLLSFHLKTLKEADLVRGRRDGRWVHYRVRPGALAELQEHLRALSVDGGSGGTSAPPVDRGTDGRHPTSDDGGPSAAAAAGPGGRCC